MEVEVTFIVFCFAYFLGPTILVVYNTLCKVLLLTSVGLYNRVYLIAIFRNYTDMAFNDRGLMS